MSTVLIRLCIIIIIRIWDFIAEWFCCSCLCLFLLALTSCVLPCSRVYEKFYWLSGLCDLLCCLVLRIFSCVSLGLLSIALFASWKAVSMNQTGHYTDDDRTTSHGSLPFYNMEHIYIEAWLDLREDYIMLYHVSELPTVFSYDSNVARGTPVRWCMNWGNIILKMAGPLFGIFPCTAFSCLRWYTGSSTL